MADQIVIPGGMALSEYDFELPEAQIAAWPAPERGRDRLLVLDRKNQSLHHHEFADIVDLLQPGDLLVMNDVRVRRARLAALKEPGGGRVEILLLSQRDEAGRVWECLLHSARAMRVGQALLVHGGPRALIIAREEERAILEFEHPVDNDLLEAIGDIPLPPYIMRQRETTVALDSLRYQTVYADRALAVAAPTAGLHFTDEILAAVRARGIQTEFITLEVGWGTFAPVRVDDIRNHAMHSERFEILPDVAERLMAARREGRRIVAVGTTVVRSLESAFVEDQDGLVIRSGTMSTDIFITPGYVFKAIDAMITNFHTPKSTLLVLVSAFAGRESIMQAYLTARDEGYRFFSYGDAMFIL